MGVGVETARVLLVSTGNQSRSPATEALLRQRLRGSGAGAEIWSAGTAAREGAVLHPLTGRGPPTSRSRPSHQPVAALPPAARLPGVRALVLGGGGITGIAWELGLVAGLAEGGVRLGEADLVVGTSAGSVVGAQLLSGAPVEELYASQLRPPSGEIAASMGPSQLVRWVFASLSSRDETKARARLGRMALRARPAATVEERLAAIASRLPSREWPNGARLLVT